MDNKDWWRGSGLDSRFQGRRHVVEEVERDNRTVLHEQMFVGTAAYKIIKGVQTSPEEVAALVAQMVVDCEIRLREATRQILDHTDPGSPEAREAHFNARVAAGMVGLLNRYVSEAAQAEHVFNNPNEEPRT